MINLTQSYIDALLEYANERGLERIYRQAQLFVSEEISIEDAPEALRRLLERLSGDREDVLPMLYAFMEAARKKMNLAEAEVYTAVPLTAVQLKGLEEKLVRMFHRQLNITATVDPSLLGGVRVIVDNTVLDDTIHRKLTDMKRSIYEGMRAKQ